MSKTHAIIGFVKRLIIYRCVKTGGFNFMGLGYGFGYDLGSCPGVPQNYGMTGNYVYNGGVNNYALPQQNYADSFTARGNIAPYKREESKDSSGKQFAILAGVTTALIGAAAVIKNVLKGVKPKP